MPTKAKKKTTREIKVAVAGPAKRPPGRPRKTDAPVLPEAERYGTIVQPGERLETDDYVMRLGSGSATIEEQIELAVPVPAPEPVAAPPPIARPTVAGPRMVLKQADQSLVPIDMKAPFVFWPITNTPSIINTAKNMGVIFCRPGEGDDWRSGFGIVRNWRDFLMTDPVTPMASHLYASPSQDTLIGAVTEEALAEYHREVYKRVADSLAPTGVERSETSTKTIRELAQSKGV